ncbi:unnamed protein product [Tenebrio molitor]|nr:unnamed protein product [Tenebrio molitor]
MYKVTRKVFALEVLAQICITSLIVVEPRCISGNIFSYKICCTSRLDINTSFTNWSR